MLGYMFRRGTVLAPQRLTFPYLETILYQN
jgi:hypothetical protein